MSEVLKSLVSMMRSHEGLEEFLRALKPEPMPRFRKGETLEVLGARTAQASGEWKQYDVLHEILTGRSSQETDSR